MLKKCCVLLEEYRNTSYKKATLDIERVFNTTRKIRRVERKDDETVAMNVYLLQKK